MRRGWLVFTLVFAGCGTTRTTDSKRAGSEMLLRPLSQLAKVRDTWKKAL